MKDKSFDEQIRIMRAENYLLPGGWAAAMEAEGFEVFETAYGEIALLARWAHEHGLARLLHQPDFFFHVLREQVKAFQPDVLFWYAGAFSLVPRDLRQKLRASAPSISVVSGFWGDELPHGSTYEESFSDVDLVFCSSLGYQKNFEAAGIRALSIGNCFEPSITFEVPRKKTRDFIFCGTSGYGYADHIGRYEKLVELMSKSKLEMWANEPNPGDQRNPVRDFLINGASRLPRNLLANIQEYGFGRMKSLARLGMLVQDTELDAASLLSPAITHPQRRYFDNLKPLGDLFASRVKKQLPNASDYYQLLAESRLVLNLHRDEEVDVGNIRCFEVTGIGSCLITDHGNGMKEFFDIENDIVTFNSVDECLAKVRYLLDHPAEIDRIAKNGQRTTLARHTVAHRCQAIAATLRNSRLAEGS